MKSGLELCYDWYDIFYFNVKGKMEIIVKL